MPCPTPTKKFLRNALQSRFRSASMSGMESHGQANGAAIAAAHLMSPHSAWHGVAGKWLVSGIICTRVVSMKTRPNTGSVATGVVQLYSYAVVSQAERVHSTTRATPQGRRCYTRQHGIGTRPNGSHLQQFAHSTDTRFAQQRSMKCCQSRVCLP